MKIVLTSMVGDFFHIGHLNLLQKASELGTLIVAIPTSYSNEIIKGYPTAISFEDRLRMIQAIKGVHLCLGYADKEAWLNLIKFIRPGIICRGDDQIDFIGKKEAEEVGAEVVLFKYTQGISSTHIVNRWKEQNGVVFSRKTT